MLDEIAQKLVAAGEGVLGQDLFIAHMPVDAQRGVMLTNDLMGVAIDPELPGYHRASFQVIVRDVAYREGRDRAQRILDLLHTQQRQVLGTWTFNWILARHLPVAFPRSEGNMREFSVNFDVSAVRSA